MGAYGANVTVEDRWHLAYLRALQLTRLARGRRAAGTEGYLEK